MDGSMATPLLLLLPALLLLLLLLHLRRRPTAAIATPRNHCPHPNPVLGNLVPFLRNLHRFLDWTTDLLAAAPTSTILVRGVLGLGNGIATANPAVVDHLLRAGFPNYVKGARFAVPFSDLLGHGMFLADGRLWSLQRKLASYSFSSRSLRRFSARVLRAHLRRRLLPFLDAAADSGEAVDLQDVLKRFAFDNICNVAFGVESSTLLQAGDRRHEAFFAAFDDAVEISMARVFHPTSWVWRTMKLANVGSERRLRESISVIDDYVAAIMESEQLRGGSSGDEQHQHLLSRFAAAMDEEAGGNELAAMFGSPEAKRRFLRDIVVSFVLAGKDTTSAALTWFFWLLAANPRCERRVYEEVSRHGDVDDDGRRAGAGDEDDDGYDELKGMHYLHAALTEAMRLYPPVPINSRVAAAADVLPDGTSVRAGWFADYSAYAMGRMPRLWGDDCREFRPERWLDGDGEFVAADAARYPVFHAGPRACLGKEMAYVQMKAVVAAVVRRFAVQTAQEPASMAAPPLYEMTATLRMKGGLPVRISRRDGETEAHHVTAITKHTRQCSQPTTTKTSQLLSS